MNRESPGNEMGINSGPGRKKPGGALPLESLFRPSGQNHGKISHPFQIRSEVFRKSVFCFSAVMSCRKGRRSKKSCKERQDRIRTKVQRVFLSDPSVKEKRKAGEDREDFHPEHSGEVKKFSQVKRQKHPGADQKKFLRSKQDGERKPSLFPSALPPLCTRFPSLFHPFYPSLKTGVQKQITASQLLIFPARCLFTSALSGAAHGLRRKEKLAA